MADKKYTKQDAQVIADAFSMIVMPLDLTVENLDLEKAEEMLKDMRSNANMAASVSPIIGGMDKAYQRSHEAEVFEAFINLVKARKEQKADFVKRVSDKTARDLIAELF